MIRLNHELRSRDLTNNHNVHRICNFQSARVDFPLFCNLAQHVTKVSITHHHKTIVTSPFSKSSVFKPFPSTLKREWGVFKFIRFFVKSVSEKLRFYDRLVWTVGLTVEIKLRFYDGLVWTVGLAPFLWRISVDGRPNRRNKAPFLWRISVDGRPNCRKKAPFLWRISVDGRPNRRNKAAFSWRISVDGRPNRRNKAAFS